GENQPVIQPVAELSSADFDLAFLSFSLRRHSHPARATAPTPSAPRFKNWPRFGVDVRGSINSRNTSTSGELLGLLCRRRSGAGTQRERYANASEPHLGQSWVS